MRCDARVVGWPSPKRRVAADIDDRAAGDAGTAVVGLKPVADVPDIGTLVVLVVGVQLHEHQHPVGAHAVLQPVRAAGSRRGSG
jgi:hypothetical protein